MTTLFDIHCPNCGHPGFEDDFDSLGCTDGGLVCGCGCEFDSVDGFAISLPPIRVEIPFDRWVPDGHPDRAELLREFGIDPARLYREWSRVVTQEKEA